MTTGIAWQFRKGDGDELIQAREALRARHGADAFTGKVYGRQPVLADSPGKMLGVEEDPKTPAGCWLFVLKEAR